MDLQLAGKKVLVTGGSKGIGRAIVESFLREGAEVAFCARQHNVVADSLIKFQTLGPRVIGSVVDVGNEEGLRAWVRSTAEVLGGIDCVVSNVSAASNNWKDMLDIDVMAAVILAEEARPFLAQSGAGSMVAISSRAAYTGGGAYAALKCALMSFMKGISDEWAGEGIRSNVVSPGDIYFADGIWEKLKNERPDIWAEALVRNKMGRLGTPEEVANVVVFLSSPVASFISGANIRVDGAGSPTTQF